MRPTSYQTAPHRKKETHNARLNVAKHMCYQHEDLKMSILDWFKEVPLSAVLRERLVDFEREIVALRNRVAELEAENAVLREKVSTLEAKISTLEEKVSTLEAENAVLKAENSALKNQVFDLKKEKSLLNIKLDKSEDQRRALDEQIMKIQSDTSSGYFCDHCGSPKLKRIGNRPDRTFGKLGVKQAVFSCLKCGQESAFIDRK